ncbi:MAG TPA: hypothetical protein VF069_19685 [Streptosporangiaceae bacterium]
MAGKAVAMMAIGVTLAAGCTDGAAIGPPDQPSGGRVPAGIGYSADRLQRALLPAIAGYHQVGQPQSGDYGSLRAVQNLTQLQRQVRLDKPQCAAATRTFAASPEVQGAPAAIATFEKGLGQYATESLLAVPDRFAGKLVTARVPASCVAFHSRIGGTTSAHQVIGAARGRLGEGSRTVGVTTVSGSSRVTTWYVVLRSHGYVATLTLYGPAATRAEAERIARTAYEQAERNLA